MLSRFLELLFGPNDRPTVVINTPTEGSSTSDTTPTINLTGTDVDGDTVEYQTQIHSDSGFNELDFGVEKLETGIWPFSFDTVGVLWGAGAVSLDATSKVAGTKSLKFDMTGEASVTAIKALSADSSDYRVRFKLFLPTGWAFGASGYTSILILRTSANADVITFNLEDVGDGQKSLVVWNSITSSYYDTGIDISVNAVHSIEIRFKQSTTVGEIKVWVDNNVEGSPDYNSGSINSGGTAFRKLCFGPAYAPDACSSYYMDDFCADSDFIGARANGPLVDAHSAIDSGYTAGHPFASGEAKDYTVQSALSPGTYYIRARATDPTGFGFWSATRSFTVSSGGSDGTATPTTPNATFAAVAATVVAGAAISAAVLSSVFSAPTPTVSGGSRIAPSTPSTVVSIQAPAIIGAAAVSPPVVLATISIQAPTPSGGSSIQPSVVSAAFSAPTPSPAGGGRVSASVSSVSVSVQTPSIASGAQISSSVVQVSISAPVASGSVGTTVFASVLNASISAPGASISAGASVSPSVAQLAASAPSSQASGASRVSLSEVSAAISSQIPSVSAGAVVSASVKSMEVAFPDHVAAGSADAHASVGLLSISIQDPESVEGGETLYEIDVTTVSATFSCPSVASVAAGACVHPDTAVIGPEETIFVVNRGKIAIRVGQGVYLEL